MYSFIVFLITFIQLIVVGGAYLLQAAEVFNTLAIYGSPFYTVMTLLRSDSAFLESSPIYLALFAYHLLKYGLFFLAQTNDGRNAALIWAVLFEAAYLCTSAYFVN